MCGITGIFAFTETGKQFLNKIDSAVSAIAKRGPDSNGTYLHENVALGHTRLAVIDTTDAASQPFTDISGRYTIIFNGEFYNYKEHKLNLENKGYKFRSTSDTEVLLYLFIDKGVDFIHKVNGCFAFAIFDNIKNELFIFRDRFGIKPLVYFKDNNILAFGSEMKSLLAMNLPKEIDFYSLSLYFQLNYIPAPYSIFENFKKLLPGHYLYITKNNFQEIKYYNIPDSEQNSNISYSSAKEKLAELLEQATVRRLVSDVPLGAFLSGGIDSSVIVSLASKHVNKLNPFSIGYKNEPFFDETNYANLVAKKFNTNHTVFSLSNDDLFENLNNILDYIDEPFADSSAIPVYILSQLTRKHVTVALSGDGADEIFAGYNKHKAHWMSENSTFKNNSVRLLSPFLNLFPESRNSSFSNKVRQLKRYSKGLSENAENRYWNWCSLMNEKDANNLIAKKIDSNILKSKRSSLIHKKDGSINSVLYNDVNLVLQGDMLQKVDLMSMANALEVRVPFLDYNVVNFAFSLNSDFKINSEMKKRILQDTFREILPTELYKRPKHGFEVPMLKWFRNELSSLITEYLSNKEFIEKQGIFNYPEIQLIINKLHSQSPGESQANIWALLVFQHWWKKYFS
ncbi:MAG: asparagine synthase (glutamine-hydrolyzing) [Bacteroidetes bacterium GWA2_31_9]|nr:MAG: asparagine synthase (glutamine-hydrolyzing) [Bacteroidetes bacterium GWA2_31_9]